MACRHPVRRSHSRQDRQYLAAYFADMRFGSETDTSSVVRSDFHAIMGSYANSAIPSWMRIPASTPLQVT